MPHHAFFNVTSKHYHRSSYGLLLRGKLQVKRSHISIFRMSKTRVHGMDSALPHCKRAAAQKQHSHRKCNHHPECREPSQLIFSILYLPPGPFVAPTSPPLSLN
ncbi:hypothetical protein DPSP01_000646 [Paraphaeosphaeria sporulosa]